MAVRVLQGKRIVLGVTGSIAAYKAVALASELTKTGAIVDVIMTEAATRLVQPLSFQAITHRPVVTEMFHLLAETEIGHVTLARSADLLLIAPITANTIARLAAGLADDMLAATALATRAPIVIAPAMETGMWENPITQANVARLREARGVVVVGPGEGRLASGAVGVGRMAEPDEIVGTARMVLGRGGELAGRRVLVTAGGTQEPIDPVRVVTNRSSGRMGYALAEAARDRGAQVTLVHAPTALKVPVGVEDVAVETAQEMRDAVLAALPGTDVLIMAAAVADYRPASPKRRKIKKGEEPLSLTLERTPDILSEVAAWRTSAMVPEFPGLSPMQRQSPAQGGHQDCAARTGNAGTSLAVVVGFAAETEDLIANAQGKLERKRLDLIVANPVPQAFGEGLNQATLIDREGSVEELPPLPKDELAERVLDRVVRLLGIRN